MLTRILERHGRLRRGEFETTLWDRVRFWTAVGSEEYVTLLVGVMVASWIHVNNSHPPLRPEQYVEVMVPSSHFYRGMFSSFVVSKIVELME